MPGAGTINTKILSITELLVDNASVPAGGPFIFVQLVDNASVAAGGPFIFCSTLLDVTADVRFRFCHSCRSMSELTF